MNLLCVDDARDDAVLIDQGQKYSDNPYHADGFVRGKSFCKFDLALGMLRGLMIALRNYVA